VCIWHIEIFQNDREIFVVVVLDMVLEAVCSPIKTERKG
jgi:hypothetical protein